MHAPSNILLVSDPENGMKLMVFLGRRLGESAGRGELHRWVRTGQVRVNGGRAGAFDRVCAGDAVRVPPFAASLARSVPEPGTGAVLSPAQGQELGAGLVVLDVVEDVLVLDKPSGLPSQSGSGHDVSVVSLLRDCFSGTAYVPAPAHRLDKDTSGILLAGLTHTAQEELHSLFARSGGAEAIGMEKAYLAWVAGAWPHDGERVLCDAVLKDAAGSGGRFEAVRVTHGEGGGKVARSRATPVMQRDGALGVATLLRVVLQTGRTHQIRVQLASRGFPVIGDGKYGGPAYPRMLLHAYTLNFFWRGRLRQLKSLPDWGPPFMFAADVLQLP